MPAFAGVDHVALTVTDLDRSTRFCTEVLGLVVALDLGHGRVLLDRASGFSVGLLTYEGATDEPFSERRTGLDHLGLTARSRDELVAWAERFDELGVEHSPLQDTALGHHLNFRDPDGIALELQHRTPCTRAWSPSSPRARCPTRSCASRPHGSSARGSSLRSENGAAGSARVRHPGSPAPRHWLIAGKSSFVTSFGTFLIRLRSCSDPH